MIVIIVYSTLLNYQALPLKSGYNIANITHQLLTDCNLTILYIKYILNMFTSVL